jgi:hypothetical protein
MGIPGRVTRVAGIPRTAQLRIIGNGVVPQQAAAALRLLIQAAAAFPPDPGLAGEDGASVLPSARSSGGWPPGSPRARHSRPRSRY